MNLRTQVSRLHPRTPVTALIRAVASAPPSPAPNGVCSREPIGCRPSLPLTALSSALSAFVSNE